MASDPNTSERRFRALQSDSNHDEESRTTARSRSWMPTLWLRWIPTSNDLLAASERKILSYLRRPYEGFYVTLPPKGDVSHKALDRICDL